MSREIATRRRSVVKADWMVSEDGSLLRDPWLLIEDGIIADLASEAMRAAPPGEVIELKGMTLAPSFCDIHTHGAKGHDVMEATPEALDTVATFLASHGVGQFLPTTVTAPVDETLRSLDQLSALLDKPRAGAKSVGIHLEGPFLSHGKRGVHPEGSLQEASIELFERFWQASQGSIRLMTLAPEIAGAAELAAYATAKGVRISMGHSDADAATTRKLIAAGATSATHTLNAMRPLNHRDPGIAGVVLTDDSLYAEMICDGIHVCPEMVKLWWRAKGPERGILVTDSMSATGMPNGSYMLGGFAVEVHDGRAMANGVLAGSVLTLDRALSNLLQFTNASLNSALPLATQNPRRMAGIRYNGLSQGAAASFVALDASGALQATFIQ